MYKIRRTITSENGDPGEGAWSTLTAMVLTAAVCDRARMARDARFDGRFFIAVLSTGIYCRPICPSPHARAENVRYFASAAEAVAAGFRPCLRCRPEAAPGTPRWNGTASTVLRALRLIEKGALQEEGLEKFSGRLGVSARQLHRLFSIHLGASPIAVAKTWRLNYARQLILDTDRPMSRVALDAGFRTVRRFNDAIRARYGRTPSDLRRHPKAADSEPEGYAVWLRYREPYDWDSLLEFLAERAISGIEEIVSGVYRRTFSHDGRHGVLEVRHDARRRALEASVRVADPVSLLHVLTRLRGVFDLDADTTAIARHLRNDSVLGPLVHKYPGLRVPGAWDPLEMSVRAVLGESIVGGAGPELGDLVSRHGERLSVPQWGGGLNLTFPSAEELAKARLDEFPRVRARILRSLGQTAISDPSEESLSSVPGLSESTRQYIAFRAFREPDAFPAGVPDPQAGVAERWRPWRAYAAMYLWRANGAGPSGA
jgi:AraC family transcriptional regulator of adaptative response / DNA-3-methyladenine glycosylase II